MTYGLFKEWLEEFDTAMGLVGRRIALVVDNAPGHGTDDGWLKNITLVRLPPKTTSVSQPLDAGIIRSFKVKYSRHMIRIISHHRAPAGSYQVSVPNNLFWSCFAKAWDDVTETTIRICFAHVPTIPAAMQVELRVPTENTIDSKDKEMESLKQELKALYPGRADAIERQKDYGVLAFIKCCEGKGPTKQVMDAIKTVSKDEKFKTFFLPVEDMKAVYEDQEEHDDDTSDSDYQLEDVVHPAIENPQRFMQRRSGVHEIQPPSPIPSSQESGSPEREPEEEVIQSIEDTLDDIRDEITQDTSLGRFPDTQAKELFYTAAVHIRQELQVMRDLLVLRSPLPESN